MGQARLNKDVRIIWGLMAALLLLIAALVLPGLLVPTRSHGGDRNASTSLKTITSAQADFRANDRDGDGIHQFWRGDIAGLYTLTSKACPENGAIKLIELSVACADDRPVTDITRFAVKSAKSGYWFRAIRHDDEKKLSPDRFAVVAFPTSYPSDGRYTFVVDERNTLYCADLGHGRGLEVFPTDAELNATWSKLD